MKLTKAHITDFRCIEDSGEIVLDQVTCLVGKNESGKTSILRALERFNSTDAGTKREFDREKDWPRNKYADYKPESPVLKLLWRLEQPDIQAIEAELGKGCLTEKNVSYTCYYSGHTTVDIQLNEEKVRGHLFESCKVTPSEQQHLKAIKLNSIVKSIQGKQESNLPGIVTLLARLQQFRNCNPTLHAIDILAKLMPKMLFFESYDRISGKISIETLNAKVAQKQLSRGEQLFLTFLEFAETKLDELSHFKNAEEFFAKLEGKGNVITKRVFKYWRQNRNLEVRFTIADGRPGDPPPYNTGKVFHTRVYNRLHQVTVDFDERSAGFTWFFSFLVQFSQVKKEHGNVIILLDEPGLSLHGKAQSDLLRFIENELKPHHQVIYTTHSPFMVPPDKLEAVRTVEDIIIQKEDEEMAVLGTKVSTDVVRVHRDTLFPLQAALGYEITQSLWIGPNVLLVEGPSDILYLQSASGALKGRNREGLDRRWTVCPSGGIDKVGAFISLFAGNELNIAVLTDLASGQKAKVENLKKSELLQRGHAFTNAEFASQSEADIEDIWGEDIYLSIVNSAFDLNGTNNEITKSKLASVKESSPRVVKRIEAYFRENAGIPEFDHFTPSDWLLRNPSSLDGTASLEQALDRFEALFKKLNQLLPE